jgi:hypothetical protein
MSKHKKNPADPVLWYLFGAGGLAALLGWLWSQNTSSKKSPSPPPPQPPKACDDVKPGTLCVSNDCLTAVEGQGWFLNVAGPQIFDAVYSGKGIPLLNNDVEILNNSLDAAVRNILSKSAPACVGTAPWLDLYIKTHPMPMPNEGESRISFYKRVATAGEAYKAVAAPWVQAHAQLAAVIRHLSLGVLEVFMESYGLDPTYTPTDQGAQGLTNVQKGWLMSLKYDLTPDVVQVFQNDFNNVMGFRTEMEWFAVAMDIEPTGTMDQDTVLALEHAVSLVQNSGVPWGALVASTGVMEQKPRPPLNTLSA